MVTCIILKKNDTIKYKKVNDKFEEFIYNEGTYYIKRDKIKLKKGIKFYKPYLLYVEGISEPLSFNNIQKDEDDETILIDAKSIHSMTSEKILSVLSSSRMSSRDKLILFAVVFNIILTLISLGMAYG